MRNEARSLKCSNPPVKDRTDTRKIRSELAALPREEWPTPLRRLVSEQVGLILRRAIDPDRPLSEYGLDSLGDLELRTRIEAETGVRITPWTSEPFVRWPITYRKSWWARSDLRADAFKSRRQQLKLGAITIGEIDEWAPGQGAVVWWSTLQELRRVRKRGKRP